MIKFGEMGICLTFLLLFCCAHASAEEGGESAASSGYSLSRPVPRKFLRELSPDRPDKTESPYTVDAGWYQIEADGFSYVHDESMENALVKKNVTLKRTLILKAGISSAMDLEIALIPYVSSRTREGSGPFVKSSGVGDTTFRLKVNLFGNDGKGLALGLIPYYQMPTAKTGLGSGAGGG